MVGFKPNKNLIFKNMHTSELILGPLAGTPHHPQPARAPAVPAGPPAQASPGRQAQGRLPAHATGPWRDRTRRDRLWRRNRRNGRHPAHPVHSQDPRARPVPLSMVQSIHTSKLSRQAAAGRCFSHRINRSLHMYLSCICFNFPVQDIAVPRIVLLKFGSKMLSRMIA